MFLKTTLLTISDENHKMLLLLLFGLLYWVVIALYILNERLSTDNLNTTIFCGGVTKLNKFYEEQILRILNCI